MWTAICHCDNEPEVSPKMLALWCLSATRRRVPVDFMHARDNDHAPFAYRALGALEKHVGKPAPEGELTRIGAATAFRIQHRLCVDGASVETLEANIVLHQIGIWILQTGVELFPSVDVRDGSLHAIGLVDDPGLKRLLPVVLPLESRFP